jgi:tetratricopeptide (TPR) repeat protein
MIKIFFLLMIPYVVIISCSLTDDCPENINKLPMYGRAKKCIGQIESDNTFIKLCADNYKGDSKEAAKHFVQRGWEYFYKNKPDTAMMRFNQAWLLDSLNAETYWGFANLTGMQQKYDESLPLFQRALALAPGNAKIWESASNSYGNLFFKTKNRIYLNKSIEYLKQANHLEPGSARTNASLAGAYSYFAQKDSARKYLKIADGIDRGAVNPAIRKAVTGQ